MPSLVSDFIINPVLRQARRFSSGFATDDQLPVTDLGRRPRCSTPLDSDHNASDVISETDEDDSIATADSRMRRSGCGGSDLDRNTAHGGESLPAGMTGLGMVHPPPPDEASQDEVDSDRPRTSTESAESASSPQERPGLQPRSPAQRVASPSWGSSETRGPLPEDDGMGVLRRRIFAIQAQDMAQADKAHLMHLLLSEGYTKSQIATQVQQVLRPESPSSAVFSDRSGLAGPLQTLKFWNPLGDGPTPLDLPLTESDLQPTYVPQQYQDDDRDRDGFLKGKPGGGTAELHLGCEHYRRNVKMQCAICDRWYTCRLCHDAAEEHTLPRQETKNMLCMLCGCTQRASDTCIKCGETAAYYYCGVCKLWSNDPNKSIYHCNDCGLCRLGEGLGRDFIHCLKCSACIAIGTKDTHKCLERSLQCGCPICNEYLFSSPTPVCFMPCGHPIHQSCWTEHMKTSYRCPICNKSSVNMETQFRNYDKAISEQPMPVEYRDTRAVISCNDCGAKSQTLYHWLGLKCSICHSYNTVQQQLLNMPANATAVGPGVAPRQVNGQAGTTRRAEPEATEAQATVPTVQNSAVPMPPTTRRRPTQSTVTAAGLDGSLASSEAIGETDFSEEEDMLDFWGREETRNVMSAESAEDVGSDGDSEGDSDTDDGCENELDEEEEDDEDEIVLFGHR